MRAQDFNSLRRKGRRGQRPQPSMRRSIHDSICLTITCAIGSKGRQSHGIGIVRALVCDLQEKSSNTFTTSGVAGNDPSVQKRIQCTGSSVRSLLYSDKDWQALVGQADGRDSELIEGLAAGVFSPLVCSYHNFSAPLTGSIPSMRSASSSAHSLYLC